MRAHLAGLALMAAAGEAQAWRCNTYLVEPGQTLYEVRERCGDPEDAQRRTEWRVQNIVQQQCQTFMEPMSPPAPVGPGKAPASQPAFRPRTVCSPYSVPITVPVEVEEWYFDDQSVPKLLHFENGRLTWIEPLWRLRHR